LRGIVELSGRGNRGGAAGRAAESDETNENVEPVVAAAPAMAPVAKADPSAVAEDTTCLDELD
jgi:hypothetical protein